MGHDAPYDRASAYLDGEYGFRDICLGVPVRISGGSLAEIIQIDLDGDEKKMLGLSAAAVTQEIDEIRGGIR